jgi:hypothetical protein
VSKHTPGPWAVVAHEDDDEGYAVVGGEYQMPVALPQSTVGGEAEELANARLIAAAPDLLDALRRLLATSRGNASEHEAECGCAVHEADKAIERAFSAGGAA